MKRKSRTLGKNHRMRNSRQQNEWHDIFSWKRPKKKKYTESSICHMPYFMCLWQQATLWLWLCCAQNAGAPVAIVSYINTPFIHTHTHTRTNICFNSCWQPCKKSLSHHHKWRKNQKTENTKLVYSSELCTPRRPLQPRKRNCIHVNQSLIIIFHYTVWKYADMCVYMCMKTLPIYIWNLFSLQWDIKIQKWKILSSLSSSIAVTFCVVVVVVYSAHSQRLQQWCFWIPFGYKNRVRKRERERERAVYGLHCALCTY